MELSQQRVRIAPPELPAPEGTNVFQFEHGGRVYSCSVQESKATDRTPAEEWWWVEVSGDRARYALCRADASDTESSVRERVVTYYESLLARRAAPPNGWWSRGKGTKGASPDKKTR